MTTVTIVESCDFNVGFTRVRLSQGGFLNQIDAHGRRIMPKDLVIVERLKKDPDDDDYGTYGNTRGRHRPCVDFTSAGYHLANGVTYTLSYLSSPDVIIVPQDVYLIRTPGSPDHSFMDITDKPAQFECDGIAFRLTKEKNGDMLCIIDQEGIMLMPEPEVRLYQYGQLDHQVQFTLGGYHFSKQYQPKHTDPTSIEGWFQLCRRKTDKISVRGAYTTLNDKNSHIVPGPSNPMRSHILLNGEDDGYEVICSILRVPAWKVPA